MRKLTAVVFIALLALTACGGDDPERTPEPTGAPTSEPTPSVAETTIDVEVTDGEVVGGMKRVEVALGNEVRLQVRSDVADEVHVHGYDIKADIAAGGGVNVPVFIADVPGVFVVELEQRQLHILELEVS